MPSAATPRHTVFCRRLYACRPITRTDEVEQIALSFEIIQCNAASPIQSRIVPKNVKTGGDDHNRSGAHRRSFLRHLCAHRRAHFARADGRRTPETLHTRYICIIGTSYATLTHRRNFLRHLCAHRRALTRAPTGAPPRNPAHPTYLYHLHILRNISPTAAAFCGTYAPTVAHIPRAPTGAAPQKYKIRKEP